MTEEKSAFNLTGYETAVYQGNFAGAYEQLILLLNEIDQARIVLGAEREDFNGSEEFYMTRVAAATVALLVSPQWDITDKQYIELAVRHDSFSKVFALSAYGSPEHAMTLISAIEYDAIQKIKRWYLCVSLSSSVEMYQILMADRQLAFPKIVAMIGQSCVLNKHEEDNKAYLIENSGVFFEGITMYSDTLVPVVGKTWMECSYAVTDKRHLVKLHLNHVIQRSYQIQQVPEGLGVCQERQSIGVVIEVMRQGHAMFRCYRNILAALNKQFEVTIYAKDARIDDAVKALASHFVEVNFKEQKLEQIADTIRENGHDMIYYPSLGMDHWTIILCNYRLAPIQVMTYGHPGSSCSSAIDFVFFDADIEADPECLTEKIILNEKGLNTFVRNSTLENFSEIEPEEDGVIHIAVTSSFLKLNWLILYVCSELVKRTDKKLHFHFFVAGSGRMSSYISMCINEWLEKYTVYEEMPYDDYLSYLSRCAIRLGTIPFAGTNTTIDCMTLGIPSVVFDGPEVFSHFEPVLLKRLQQEGEDWIDKIICPDVAEYIEKALWLIEDDEARSEHSHHLVSAFKDSEVIIEDAETDRGNYASAFKWLFDNIEAIRKSEQKVFRTA